MNKKLINYLMKKALEQKLQPNYPVMCGFQLVQVFCIDNLKTDCKITTFMQTILRSFLLDLNRRIDVTSLIFSHNNLPQRVQ